VAVKRTTLALDERLLARIREKARREGRTIQDCTNELLRLGFDAGKESRRAAEPLPVFDLGPAAVDLADREALYELMERESE